MATVPIRLRYGVRTIPIADIQAIAERFDLNSEFVSAERYGSGHINETFLVKTGQGPWEVRFILQRINSNVFHDPVTLMENVRRVTVHLQHRRPHGQTSLMLVPTIDGADFHRDEQDEVWRVYRFLAGTRSYDSADSTALSRQAAMAFGRFQHMLSDLPAPRLHETIPDFHNTPVRFQQLHEALKNDSKNRARHCRREIDLVLGFERDAGALVTLLEAGEIPERIVHNDTKINNVMFELENNEAVCVIDLDTVMPGIALYDFGDLVRTATTPTAEDETDPVRIHMRMDYFEALVEGYLSTAMQFLTAVEIENLAMAGRIMTIETGVRFLTDYLSGDEYFRTHRPQQNLDRCKAQFALVASIDAQFDEMQKLVAKVASDIKTKAS